MVADLACRLLGLGREAGGGAVELRGPLLLVGGLALDHEGLAERAHHVQGGGPVAGGSGLRQG